MAEFYSINYKLFGCLDSRELLDKLSAWQLVKQGTEFVSQEVNQLLT
jgi:hypothetical protein